MALITLDAISKQYGHGDAQTHALADVSLTIEQGEFVAIMGPSGCGKSTLMHIIGLLDQPSEGTYSLDNVPVESLLPRQAARLRRDRIGFIFQSYNMIDRLTLLDNVALPLLYKGWGQTKRLEAASRMLDRVGLKPKEYFLPAHVSGGQVQSAAIARALVTDPQLIIADEPTGNLDSAGSRLVMELLGDINRLGNTVLFVTHNPELTRYASRVIYMRDGKIVNDEATAIGDLASGAERSMQIFRRTIDDDLAGVSTLMTALPQSQSKPRPPGKKVSTRRHKVVKRRKVTE